MSSVSFPVAIGGDGSTVNDTDDAVNGLAAGGFRTRLIPAFAQFVAVANYLVSLGFQSAGTAFSPVVAYAEANITLSGTQTIDGVALTAGQRVWAGGQTTASARGPYNVSAGAWTRCTDADASTDFVNGKLFVVTSGTKYGGALFQLNNPPPFTLGTTAPAVTRINSTGRNAVNVLARDMAPRTTAGAGVSTTQSATNSVILTTLDFDQATQEFAQFQLLMPKRWNLGSITAKFLWTSSATGAVVWTIAAVGVGNGETLDAAFGAAATATDTLATANTAKYLTETGPFTPAGTLANEDLVTFQVSRDAANVADTLAADARLLAVRLYLNFNAGNDA